MGGGLGLFALPQPQPFLSLKVPLKLKNKKPNRNLGIGLGKPDNKKKRQVENFGGFGLTEEVLVAVREMSIEVPTGIPAVLEGKTVVLGSHTKSGKTLAYMLPIA
ncbi:hypothetical protein L3X38_016528 [Prunus dulcis]|uniref:Uncharacterized protein n=1 Tax=Prunus dulcis TaxID=3755 RepID=A0AAD4W5L3_PRUDU|nr:hypothetical protein L3X38_016528 [Prunus dulcis]